MKLISTFKPTQLFLKSAVLMLSTFFIYGIQTLNGQTIYSQENFSNLFNGGEVAPVNTTFPGNIGVWTAQSTDVNSTIAVKSDPGVSLTDLKFVINSNSLATNSQNTATSPLVDLSILTCSAKFDFFFDLYTGNVSLGNNGTSLSLQLYNGSVWNTVWSKTANQLRNDYGVAQWAYIGLLIPNSYMGMPNFQYRFVSQNTAGNLISTVLYVDNVRILSYTCPATASVGNKIWNDANQNGAQDGGENGISGITVKLAVAPGDTLSTVTDGNGIYMFTSLPPAGYKVIFPEIPGLIITTPNSCADDIDSDIDMTTKSVIVYLANNEVNTTIDAGYKPATVLPVTLSSFSALLNKDKVDLKWTTTGEVNASHFVIEKSSNGTNYNDAGIVIALGNSNENTKYNYSDNINTMESGMLYYRLRLIDINGAIKYSQTRIIRVTKETDNNITILSYPNPVSDELRITIPAAWQNKKVFYQIVNTNGQLVNKIQTDNSIQTQTLNVSKLMSGIYMVQVYCDEQSAQQKIIKQ